MPTTNKPTTAKKDLIDLIDFSKLDAIAKEKGESGLLYEMINRQGCLNLGPQSYYSANGPDCSYGIARPLEYAYLCKYYVKNERHLGMMLGIFDVYKDYLSDENLRIVFRAFKVGNMLPVMEALETDPKVFEAVTGYSSKGFIESILKLNDHQLDLFLQETGAEKFVNYIKGRRIAEQERIAAQRKREAEARQKAAEKEREYSLKVSKRLKKLASNFEEGVYKYTLKFPFDRAIRREDIARLSLSDEGVQAMFRALVDMQTKITKPEHLKTFNDMLELMSDKFDSKACLQHTNVTKLMEIAGVEGFDSKKDANPMLSTQGIERYKHILFVIGKYPHIFRNVYGLDFPRYPHDRRFSIDEYKTPKELGLLQGKYAIKEEFDPKIQKLDSKRRGTHDFRILKRVVLNTRKGMLEKKKAKALGELEAEHRR